MASAQVPGIAVYKLESDGEGHPRGRLITGAGLDKIHRWVHGSGSVPSHEILIIHILHFCNLDCIRAGPDPQCELGEHCSDKNSRTCLDSTLV